MERVFWVATFLTIFAVAWQALDRSFPIALLEREVVNPVVPAGSHLQIRYRVKVLHEAELRFYQRLYDGAGVVYDYAVRTLPTGALDTGPPSYTSQRLIPRRAEPGHGTLVVTTCWERPYNLVHQFWPPCVTLKPFEITIAPSDRDQPPE